MKKIAIIGSRRRHNKETCTQIFNIVARSSEDTIFVSGACPEGADMFCAVACSIFKRICIEFPAVVNLNRVPFQKWLFAKAKYARNETVAMFADECIAFPHESRTGGTENTIKHFDRLGKKVTIL